MLNPPHGTQRSPLLLLQLLQKVGAVHEDVLVAVRVGAGEDLGADAGHWPRLARDLFEGGGLKGGGWGGVSRTRNGGVRVRKGGSRARQGRGACQSQ